jgi:hypothetical protein
MSNKPARPKAARRSKGEPGGLFNNVEFKGPMVVSGLVTMLIAIVMAIAIVWFLGDFLLMRGVILLVYPIILFFIGGGIFFKGITRGGSSEY